MIGENSQPTREDYDYYFMEFSHKSAEVKRMRDSCEISLNSCLLILDRKLTDEWIDTRTSEAARGARREDNSYDRKRFFRQLKKDSRDIFDEMNKLYIHTLNEIGTNNKLSWQKYKSEISPIAKEIGLNDQPKEIYQLILKFKSISNDIINRSDLPQDQDLLHDFQWLNKSGKTGWFWPYQQALEIGKDIDKKFSHAGQSKNNFNRKNKFAWWNILAMIAVGILSALITFFMS